MVAEKKEKVKKDYSVYYPFIFAIVLFVIVGAFAFNLNNSLVEMNNKLMVLEQNFVDFKNSIPKAPTVRIYYIKNCTFCSNFSDMLTYLDNNGVNYELLDVSEEQHAAYVKQIGISYFPSLQVFVPDTEMNVGLYKLTEKKIPVNDYHIIRLGDLGYLPWGNSTEPALLFYSETCEYSTLQKNTFKDMNFSYSSVCIPIHLGDDEKCKQVWGNSTYKEFEDINAVYKIKETPTLVINGKYMVVGYHTKERLNQILSSLKKV